MPDDRAKEVIKDWERRDGDRGTWKSHWQEYSLYADPNRADYTTDRAPGQKRLQYVYDATPIWAAAQAAAGLHSYLTSPYLIWFSQHLDNDRLDRDQAVRGWLEAADAAMYAVFNGPRHNFASQSQEVYRDLVGPGTAVMGVLESDRYDALFSTRHLRECCLVENEADRIDELSRRWQWTAKQAADQWGEQALGEQLRKAYAEGKPDKFWFHHRVKPRKTRDAQRADARNKAFESLYVSETDQLLISEGGFDDFPYLCPRIAKILSEIYGRGWGIDALPDIKMLNELQKLVVKAAQKIIDPPLQLPDDGYIIPIKQGPGALNYHRPGLRDKIEPIATGGNPGLGLDMIAALRQQILRAFYVEYLLMPTDPKDPSGSGKGVTATYVLQQRDEKMRLLSPVLARLQSEFLEPLINRTFAILWRKSVALKFGPGSPFPPPPDAIRGRKTRVEYVSPIAVAQKSSHLDSVRRLMETQLALKQMDPETPMVLDGEAILRLEGSDLNAPIEIIKSPDRLKQEAQNRARMAEEQHQAQLAQQGAGAAADLATARRTMREAA